MAGEASTDIEDVERFFVSYNGTDLGLPVLLRTAELDPSADRACECRLRLSGEITIFRTL